MQPSGTDYTGWRNGRAMTIATKWEGAGADKANAQVVADIVRDGYELREMPLREACDAHLAHIRAIAT